MIKWTKKDLVTLVWVTLSAFIFAASINTILYSGNFYPGGISGISLLIVRVSKDYLDLNIPYGLLYILFNLPLTYLVWNKVGRKFTIFSIVNYSLVSIITLFFPIIKLDYDMILLAIFGGLLSGISGWMVLQRNASAGGADFIAIFLSERLKRPIWSWIMGVNVVLLLIAGLLYGVEIALYSIILQFVSTQVINSRHMRYKSKSLYMITSFPDEVSEMILAHTHHGITKIWGEGAYSKKKRCLLFMVVQEVQVNQVITHARLADPNVFISVSNTEKIVGNYHQTPLE